MSSAILAWRRHYEIARVWVWVWIWVQIRAPAAIQQIRGLFSLSATFHLLSHSVLSIVCQAMQIVPQPLPHAPKNQKKWKQTRLCNPLMVAPVREAIVVQLVPPVLNVCTFRSLTESVSHPGWAHWQKQGTIRAIWHLLHCWITDWISLKSLGNLKKKWSTAYQPLMKSYIILNSVYMSMSLKKKQINQTVW